eukprot:scaffold872_cov421-Prasinococcus_capsulatus_cf.AAC.5
MLVVWAVVRAPRCVSEARRAHLHICTCGKRNHVEPALPRGERTPPWTQTSCGPGLRHRGSSTLPRPRTHAHPHARWCATQGLAGSARIGSGPCGGAHQFWNSSSRSSRFAAPGTLVPTRTRNHACGGCAAAPRSGTLHHDDVAAPTGG